MAIPRLNLWSLGSSLAGYLQKAGGTMTGALTLFGAPTVDLHAATKKYVDDQVAAAVAYPAPRVLAKTSGTSLDLANVEVVTFDYASPATISTFSNAVVNKTYQFRNIGSSAVTIDRTNAHLNGSANQVLAPSDVMLVVGRTTTAIIQVAPKSDNG